RKDLGSLEQAADDISQALVLAPEDVEVLLGAAELAEARGEFEAARGHLQRGLQLHPQETRMYQLMARLELRAGRRAEAVSYLRRSLKIQPIEPQLLWNSANLLIDAGELEDARALIARLRLDGSMATTLGYLDARLLVSERKWFLASRALEQARPLLVRFADLTLQADLLIGQCYQHLGNPDLQLAAYRRAV